MFGAAPSVAGGGGGMVPTHHNQLQPDSTSSQELLASRGEGEQDRDSEGVPYSY